ncbi:glutaredoxin family protein [Microbacterium sp. bgisy207]|uniref:glutaredoxin family protein n=1 Tax=Microbacterium sp. bgisy207 TaxID=3413800 RepID=UPI003EBEA142|tara:strand:+ start:2835 stop:3140 length:306 start_codon:yes stop_codon:yes gene_type:complete
MTIWDVTPTRPRRAPRTRTVPVAIYGNRWCGITQLIRRALDRAGVGYDYVDLDDHPSVQARLEALTGGRLRTPVVHIDGEWLMEPSLRQVQAVLARHGVWL